MGKLPYFPFYPNDWSRDLEEHPLEIEGAWIRICCKLWWSESRGILTRTILQWSRILSVTQVKAKELFLYIKTEKIGDVEIANDNITVSCRRMLQDDKNRELNRLRQERWYKKNKPNASLTAVLQKSNFPFHNEYEYEDEYSNKKKEKESMREKEKGKSFEDFWIAYPRRKNKGQAKKAWEKIKPDKSLTEKILSAIDIAKQSEDWLKDGGKFIPYPATWLNAEGWEDEIRDKGNSKWD